MKNLVLSLFVTLFVFTSLKAQNVRTFQSMGYEDATIRGVSSSISYFIKIKPDDNVEQSKLVLNIAGSPVLNPNNSFIVISIKDVPITTQRVVVSHSDTVFHIEIPLNKTYLQPDGRFIKLKIAAKMSISDEYCKDIENPAVWLNVKNTSYITGPTQSTFSYQRSLKEIIQEFGSVYTPPSADVNDLTAGALLYTIIKQNNKEVYTSVFNPQDTLLSGILVGTLDKMPDAVKAYLPAMNTGQGCIALVRIPSFTGNYKTLIVVTGADNEGYKKAINTLASNKRLNGAFSEKLLVDQAVQSSETVNIQSPLITTLEDIGGTPNLMEGIGSLKTKYNFSLTEFNAIPDRLLFHLESFFSVLKPEDRGFLNIYLNQNLVYNANLANKSSLAEDIDLKPYLLSKFNTLEVEFRFHPGSNVCKDGFGNFFAFINTKTSTLTFSGEKENKFYSFFNFPAEFRKVPTKILVSPAFFNTNIISSIGELFYQLNSPFSSNYARLIVPPIVSTDKTSVDDIKGFNLIAILHKEDPFVKNFEKLPVKYDKDFQIYKDSKGQTTYSINDFSNSGMAQIFTEKGNTVLMITSLSSDSLSNKVALESVVKNFNTQLTEIGSNVCIANNNGMSNYFFKIPEDSDLVTYRGEKNEWLIFWNQYKFIILGVLLVLVLLPYFFVRNKVKKAQEAMQQQQQS